MQVIADEEAAHAGLAFSIAAWLDAQLTPQQRAVVHAAVTRALDELPARVAIQATRHAAAAAPLGLPSTDDARHLAHGYIAAIRPSTPARSSSPSLRTNGMTHAIT